MMGRPGHTEKFEEGFFSQRSCFVNSNSGSREQNHAHASLDAMIECVRGFFSESVFSASRLSEQQGGSTSRQQTRHHMFESVRCGVRARSRLQWRCSLLSHWNSQLFVHGSPRFPPSSLNEETSFWAIP